MPETATTETVTVRLPSGEEVDALVPSGMSDEQVHGLMQQKHPEYFTQTKAAKPEGSLASADRAVRSFLEPTAENGPVARFAKGVGRTLYGIPSGIAHAFGDEESDEEKQRRESIEQAGGTVPNDRFTRGLSRMFVEPSRAASQHVEELAAQHGTKDTPAYYAGKAMAAIPVLGPWGLSAGERAAKGDVAGATGEAAAVALTPKKQAVQPFAP